MMPQLAAREERLNQLRRELVVLLTLRVPMFENEANRAVGHIWDRIERAIAYEVDTAQPDD